MVQPVWEDLRSFFSPGDFAVPAVISRDGETVAEVLGIFDDPTEVARMGELNLDNPSPRFTCAESDVGAVEVGDVALIEGSPFDIMQSPQLDGTGIAVLVLGHPNVIHNAGL